MEPSSAARSRDYSLLSESKPYIAFLALSLGTLAAARLSHLDLVWVEEAYGMAAAAELLRGKSLYTEVWFDKPPLYAWFYTLCGAQAGWPLRVLDVALALLSICGVFVLSRRLWDTRTALLAATLTSIGLTFWIPSAIMAVAPDLLMFVPHVFVVWAIASRRPFTAGAMVGVALLCNAKAILLLPLAIAWDWRGAMRLLAGFASVTAVSLAVLPVREYWQQVWWWGSQYSADTFVVNPLREFATRTAGWTWFHFTAISGTAWYVSRTRDWRVGLWLVVSLVGVVLGSRFFPRYYFQVLPVVAAAGARGLMLMGGRWRAAALALLLIPIIRFGPRYVQGVSGWSDVAMMEDSRQVSRLLPSGSLLVWGYRPDVYVFSALAAGTPFLDSQPLTGVLADRHLTDSRPTFGALAREKRAALISTRPDYIVDGLGPINTALSIRRYDDLRSWLAGYEEIGRTGMSIVYRRRPDRGSSSEKR